MSKGVGSVGIRSVRAAVLRAVGRRGGLHAIEYSRTGMRAESLAYWRSRFAGKSGAEVRALASSMPPVRVTLYHERGRTRVTLEDGRHRMQAAREAGATRIAVEARIVGERSGSSGSWRGILRI